MTSRLWDRDRLWRAVAAMLVAAMATVVIAVALAGSGAPEAWWPQTGEAFATDETPRAAADSNGPCGLIVGPAHDYCLKGDDQYAAPIREFGAAEAWMILPPTVGLLLLGVLWLCTARRS